MNKEYKNYTKIKRKKQQKIKINKHVQKNQNTRGHD